MANEEQEERFLQPEFCLVRMPTQTYNTTE